MAELKQKNNATKRETGFFDATEAPQISDCTNDTKIKIVLSELDFARSKLEKWQLELADCPAKKEETLSRIVSHYSYLVTQYNELLIDLLNR